MHRRWGPLAVGALLTVIPACGSDDVSSTTADSIFCDAWAAAVESGDDSRIDEVLKLAPDELEDEASVVRDANERRLDGPGADRAGSEILDWVQLNCARGDSAVGTRRVAPPAGTAFDGLTFCGNSAFPSLPADEAAGVVLYADTAADDPYDGPMLGLVWNAADETHIGDGDARSVTVRGQRGAAAPITVFQQTVLPELGSVVAWTEGGRAFGLYGRGWSIERTDELVEIAEGIEERGDGFGIADDALPGGFSELFAGDPGALALVLPPSSNYSLRFDAADGLLQVTGLEMSESEFEAFRFLTVGIERGEVAGRAALVGNAWNVAGPAVVTWREPDGLVVRIVGLGVPLATAQEVAAQSRELSDAEWKAVVEAEDGCSDSLPRGR
jgi:hypothetical protein